MNTALHTKITPFSDDRVESIIEELKALRPLIQANSSQGEEQRSPTREVEEKVYNKLKLLNLLTPRRWGGGGLSPTGFARVQQELGKADLSVSWVNQILNGSTVLATLTSDAIQEAIFGNGPTTVCSAYNPPGKAKKVDGGYILSGAWPYSSGSRQAKWMQAGCLITDSEGPIVPGINMCFVPMDQLEIQDTWFVTGMQGTGSDTTVAKEVFVPDEMMVTMDKPIGTIDTSKKHFGAASDYLPVVPTVRCTGIAQLLGGAQYMLELVAADAPKKPIVTTFFAKRVDSHVFVQDLGKVAAQLDSAELILFDAIGQLDKVAEAGGKMTALEAAKNRAQCAQVIELIHASMEKLMFMAGSSAFVLSNPLQRYWRDLSMGLRHVQNIPTLGYEIYGRDLLEISPNISPAGAY
ncbi:MAG: hypothetical protein WC247_09160 [Porticoccaceae bacterium]|jgi:alkylation response protein AidB-like acyl-CoA dehydrogenase